MIKKNYHKCILIFQTKNGEKIFQLKDKNYSVKGEYLLYTHPQKIKN